MRMGLFLLVSLALHTTALTYPVFFLSLQGEELVPVVVLSLEDGKGDKLVGDGRTEGKEGRSTGPKLPAQVKPLNQLSDDTEKTAGPENPIAIPVSPIDGREAIAMTSDIASEAALPAETFASFSMQYGTGGEGEGSGSFGAGTGAGDGRGDGGGGSGFAQVAYAYTPKPEYPDRARIEGWEGIVLLRVLVDEDGKPKSVGLNRSSGFESLDHAAVETVRRWRFSPARYRERRIESWVKIPVVFRLMDLKD
jgi:periplasmic protein TonB